MANGSSRGAASCVRPRVPALRCGRAFETRKLRTAKLGRRLIGVAQLVLVHAHGLLRLAEDGEEHREHDEDCPDKDCNQAVNRLGSQAHWGPFGPIHPSLDLR